ncbi:hypothetical protein TREES_T100014543 [Tupaia chinensis]|uniref:Uncharacterized protein n=1 Tax=Tupaia chinensis TaxID=246437 RepID=L9LC21_TUPCH|nr:hypothetical protein TREES_T100014543 [Tupaia chinensis]
MLWNSSWGPATHDLAHGALRLASSDCPFRLAVILHVPGVEAAASISREIAQRALLFSGYDGGMQRDVLPPHADSLRGGRPCTAFIAKPLQVTQTWVTVLQKRPLRVHGGI